MDTKLEFPKGFINYQMKEEEVTAYTLIYLCLHDYVIHKVQCEVIAKGIWKRLDGIYNQKTLSRKFHLKEQWFNFKMDISKNLEFNPLKFWRIVSGLVNIEEGLGYENLVHLLYHIY